MSFVHCFVQMLCPDIAKEHTLSEALKIVLIEHNLRLFSGEH